MHVCALVLVYVVSSVFKSYVAIHKPRGDIALHTTLHRAPWTHRNTHPPVGLYVYTLHVAQLYATQRFLAELHYANVAYCDKLWLYFYLFQTVFFSKSYITEVP